MRPTPGCVRPPGAFALLRIYYGEVRTHRWGGVGSAACGDGSGLERGVGAGAFAAAVDLPLADQPEGQAGAEEAEDPAEQEDLVEAVEESFFGRVADGAAGARRDAGRAWGSAPELAASTRPRA